MNHYNRNFKTKECLGCGILFERWHSARLYCPKCFWQTPEGKLNRKIRNDRYYGTRKYYEALARSRRRSYLKLKKKSGTPKSAEAKK